MLPAADKTERAAGRGARRRARSQEAAARRLASWPPRYPLASEFVTIIFGFRLSAGITKSLAEVEPILSRSLGRLTAGERLHRCILPNDFRCAPSSNSCSSAQPRCSCFICRWAETAAPAMTPGPHRRARRCHRRRSASGKPGGTPRPCPIISRGMVLTSARRTQRITHISPGSFFNARERKDYPRKLTLRGRCASTIPRVAHSQLTIATARRRHFSNPATQAISIVSRVAR